MTYSDLLSSISILTSIVFGFYITHWYSIRDSRTRVVKDYYIEQVKGIKGRVDKFFHQVAWGKKSARYIISWNKHIDLDIDSIDNGVRKVLDIHIASFGDLLATFYQEITMWDDYNTQFGRATYTLFLVNINSDLSSSFWAKMSGLTLTTLTVFSLNLKEKSL